MKKLLFILLLSSNISFGQSQEAKQLLLDVEKLAQLKQMLAQMKTGYDILHKGYTSIKNISKGNFDLHKTFLDGLLQISPAVRKYKKIAEIIDFQLKIVKEYRSAFTEFRSSKHFTADEIDYMGKVYGNLFSESLKKLEELAMVITAGELRMSDDERLKAIDKIYEDVFDQYTFLNEFNNSTALLSVQRDNDQREIDLMRKIHGIK
jgi:hypothetical protein